MGTLAWKLFGQQAAGLGAFFAAYYLSGFLPQPAVIALASVFGAGAFIGYIVCSVRNVPDGLWLFPVLFSAAAGFSAGICFCRFESRFFENWPTAAAAAGISLVNALVQFPRGRVPRGRVRTAAAGLIAAGTLALSVFCFCRWNGENALAYREAAFVFVFLFMLLLGEFFYIWLGGDVRRKTNLAFCAAFFAVLFAVLLIVTEGDAADGIGDALTGGTGEGGEKRRGRRRR